MKGTIEISKSKVSLAGRVIGTVDSIIFEVDDATPQEIAVLMTASSLTLARQDERVRFTPSYEHEAASKMP